MGKNDLREFEIQFVNLSTGEHIFDFEILPSFFDHFSETLVDHGEGKAQLKLLKTDNMLTLFFDIGATLKLICDVSLESFDYPIKIEKRLLIKFGEEEFEPDDEVVFIRFDRISVNVASWIHEFINLEIPMKKVHPKIENNDRPDIAYTSPIEREEEGEKIDPRWEALKNLKNKN
jgi:uncharacterized protein